jgi:sortase A
MRDRRAVEDLSIDELEEILRLRRREARLERLERYARAGRRSHSAPLPDHRPTPPPDDDPIPEIAHTSFVHDSRELDRKARRDRLLLIVEVVAAAGLVAVLIFAAMQLRDLNAEAASAQAGIAGELTATPVIRSVVLPGGHTPPTASEGARPNYDEVPARLRPQVEQQFALPAIASTQTPAQATRITISAIDVDAPVVQGDGWEQLKKGVGQHIGSADPGQVGNVVFSAHNDIYGEIFRHLDRLEAGDEVTVQTPRQSFTYRIEGWQIVEPTEVSVMDPTSEPTLTLISCYPYLVNSERIVVTATLVE